MPFNLPPIHIKRFFKTSKSQGSNNGNRPNQAAHGKTSHSNVIGNGSLDQAPVRRGSLSRAQAIHREDMALARAPVEYVSQMFPIPKRPRFFGVAEALQDPECVFLPRPSLQPPLRSGLGERRRHHDRNPCGLCIHLKPTLLSRHAPPRYSTEWEIAELRQEIWFAQHRSRGRAADPEPQNGTSEAVEAQVKIQLKSPNQGRIPEEQLIAARERTLRLVKNGLYNEPINLFTAKEKMGLRLLRQEIAKFPQIRADVLAVCPEMENHPLYCSNEHLEKLGIDSSWGITEVSKATAPALAPAPTQGQERRASSPKTDDASACPYESAQDLSLKDDKYIDSLQPVSEVAHQELPTRNSEFRSLYDELREQLSGTDALDLRSKNDDLEQHFSVEDHYEAEGELLSPDDDDRDVLSKEF